ncbi:MAG TPA: glucokinase, partial [Xanthobacteraceae bacterium]
MASTLLADIGGSTTRFAVCERGGRPDCVMVVDNETVSGPEAAIRRYLGKTGLRPQSAVLAVAGPVDGDDIRLTNRPWRFNLRQVGERFGIARVHAINDFEAVAHALAVLRPDELCALGPAA